MVNRSASKKRTYRSDLRARQAGETRQRIVAAAGKLFAELGYTGTTLAKIAAEAGVSPETVQAHGPKAALLRAAIEVAALGGEDRDTTAEIPEAAALFELDRDHVAAGVGNFLRGLHERVAGTYEALAGAAAADAELRGYLADMVAIIRSQWASTFATMRERGWFRDDLDFERSIDEWCVVGGPDAYLRLVRDFGWSGRQYAAWLTEKFGGYLA